MQANIISAVNMVERDFGINKQHIDALVPCRRYSAINLISSASFRVDSTVFNAILRLFCVTPRIELNGDFWDVCAKKTWPTDERV